MTTNVDRDVACVQDAIFKLCGHRARPVLVARLLTYARWELAIEVASSGVTPDNAHLLTLKLNAYSRLREQPAS